MRGELSGGSTSHTDHFGDERMRWIDVHDIAIALEDMYPTVDIVNVRFTDLWKWVQALPGFDDMPERSNERILEAIQMAWLSERG